MKHYDQIHETAVKEIIDLYDAISSIDADDSKGVLKNIMKNRSSGGYRSSSISRAADDMTLVFPVLTSRSVDIGTAAMISKAIEKKCVAMLQLLFSAYQVSDKANAVDFIKQFHSNLDSRSMSADDLLDIFGRMSESDTHIDKNRLNTIMEDLKHNTNYVLPSDINECSLNDYGVYNNTGKPRIVVEAYPVGAGLGTNSSAAARYREERRRGYQGPSPLSIGIRGGAGGGGGRNNSGTRTDTYDKHGNLEKYTTTTPINNGQRTGIGKVFDVLPGIGFNVNVDPAAAIDRFRYERDRDKVTNVAPEWSDVKSYMDAISKQILPGDIRKANELMPTNLVVNYKYVDPEHPDMGIVDICSVIVGVKAKLYYTDSIDIVNHIVSKTNDKNWITQFFRGTTREISFWKDFIFAIDRAKIDAMSLSNKGSSSKMWKALERRAKNSKLRRTTGNGAGGVSAITTLVISQEEVELIKRTNSIDIEKVSLAKNLLEGYNLLGLCIVDDSLEVAKFLFDDNDPIWENISYTNLEREASDNAYKRVVNMMTKVAR